MSGWLADYAWNTFCPLPKFCWSGARKVLAESHALDGVYAFALAYRCVEERFGAAGLSKLAGGQYGDTGAHLTRSASFLHEHKSRLLESLRNLLLNVHGFAELSQGCIAIRDASLTQRHATYLCSVV